MRVFPYKMKSFLVPLLILLRSGFRLMAGVDAYWK
jgi:hypothetical protein